MARRRVPRRRDHARRRCAGGVRRRSVHRRLPLPGGADEPSRAPAAVPAANRGARQPVRTAVRRDPRQRRCRDPPARVGGIERVPGSPRPATGVVSVPRALPRVPPRRTRSGGTRADPRTPDAGGILVRGARGARRRRRVPARRAERTERGPSTWSPPRRSAPISSGCSRRCNAGTGRSATGRSRSTRHSRCSPAGSARSPDRPTRRIGGRPCWQSATYDLPPDDGSASLESARAMLRSFMCPDGPGQATGGCPLRRRVRTGHEPVAGSGAHPAR